MALARLRRSLVDRAGFILENLALGLRSGWPARTFRVETSPVQPKAATTHTHIVMCTWKRIPLLAMTIRDLNQQVGIAPHLHVWNNNFAASDALQRLIAKAEFPVSVINSEKNVGGYGRFFFAKEIGQRIGVPDTPIIFIDDDQTFPTTAMRDLSREYQPGTIRSIWAFRFKDTRNYWQRVRANAGEAADYCGTCGMILPVGVFDHPFVFECPRRYWFVEDLWLSFVCAHFLGMQLLGSGAPIGFLSDGLNQVDRLAYRKSRMLRYLTEGLGWKLHNAALSP